MIKEYFKNNKFSILITCIFFAIGFAIGFFSFKHSSEDFVNWLKIYSENLKNLNVSKLNMLLQYFSINREFILIILLIPTAVIINIPVIIGITGYRGYLFGILTATLFSAFEVKKSFILLSLGLIPGQLIILMILIMLTSACINATFKFLTEKRNFKSFYRDSIITVIFSLILFLISGIFNILFGLLIIQGLI